MGADPGYNGGPWWVTEFFDGSPVLTEGNRPDDEDDNICEVWNVTGFSARFRAVDGAFTKKSHTLQGIAHVVNDYVCIEEGVGPFGDVVLSGAFAHGAHGRCFELSREVLKNNLQR